MTDLEPTEPPAGRVSSDAQSSGDRSDPAGGAIVIIDTMSSYVACHRCGAYYCQLAACPRCGR